MIPCSLRGQDGTNWGPTLCSSRKMLRPTPRSSFPRCTGTGNWPNACKRWAPCCVGGGGVAGGGGEPQSVSCKGQQRKAPLF